jgi:hypothetical protein
MKDLNRANELFRKHIAEFRKKYKHKQAESWAEEMERVCYYFYLKGYTDNSGMSQLA